MVKNNKSGLPLISKFYLYISLFLYVTSLMLPAVVVTDLETGRQINWSGYEALLGGWLGAIFGNLAWFANISYIVTIIAFTKNNKVVTLKSSVVSVFFLLSLPMFIVNLLPGGYLWISSILLPGLHMLTRPRTTTKSTDDHNQTYNMH